jgi:AraC-like DNA-binding protein
MTEALSRIAQGIAPGVVAQQVGYASVPAFGAAFRATFGTTPAMAAPRREGSAAGGGEAI